MDNTLIKSEKKAISNEKINQFLIEIWIKPNAPQGTIFEFSSGNLVINITSTYSLEILAKNKNIILK